jgi:hypothetical protein
MYYYKRLVNKITKSSYFSKLFLAYVIKWQLGIFVSWPIMYIMKDVLGWGNFVTIISFQFIGALIYWPIDRYIFKRKK